MTSPRPLHLMTVDVEEHFQVSAFEDVVSRASWDAHPSRVDANTGRLLDLFDELGIRATFFVLGWIGERRPELVRRIAERGHELASHGYSHRLVYRQSRGDFRDETIRAKAVLEDASGVSVDGYRAASFSIDRRNLWALDELVDAGFAWDSSLFPVRHDRYGIPGAPRRPFVARTPEGRSIVEIPPSTARVAGWTLPFGGGGYLRLFPVSLTKRLFRRMERLEGRGGVVYLHPWEVDPDQPRIRASWKSRFRHYVGLRGTLGKLRALHGEFRFGPVSDLLAAGPSLDEVEL